MVCQFFMAGHKPALATGNARCGQLNCGSCKSGRLNCGSRQTRLCYRIPVQTLALMEPTLGLHPLSLTLPVIHPESPKNTKTKTTRSDWQGNLAVLCLLNGIVLAQHA